VLHSYDWSESSLVVELFARELGRVIVVARGAKRPHSQLRAVLLPLQRISVHLSARRRSSAPEATGDDASHGQVPQDGGDDSEFHLLRSAEWASGSALPGGAALMSGFYLNELLLRALARHDPHPELFDAYAATLPLLGAGDPDETTVAGARLAAALRAFELRLLRSTGLLPEFDRVTATQAALDLHDPEARYLLRGEAGLMDVRHLRHMERHLERDGETPWGELRLAREEGGGGLIAPLCLAIESALQQDDLLALQTACLGAPGELKQQLRRTLHYHFGERALRTRQVMQGIQQLLGGTGSSA
jgi:DNA repair protein RecO (recombination protein O)